MAASPLCQALGNRSQNAKILKAWFGPNCGGAISLVLEAEERFGDGVGVVWQGWCMALHARHLWAMTSSHVDAVAAPPE